MKRENISVSFFLVLAFTAMIAVFWGNAMVNNPCGRYEYKNITIGNSRLNLRIADDECKREAGLSVAKALKENEGMIFVFTEESGHGMWMQDMNFPIDAIWINSNKEVVSLQSGLSPESYPQVFGDDVASSFVLELPSGFIEANGISLGDIIEI